MFVRDPERTVTYKEDVQDTLVPYLERYERLGELILAIEFVLKRNPEEESTVAIGDEDQTHRYITRFPMEELDIPLPKIQLLYEYTEEEIIFWAVRVEED